MNILFCSVGRRCELLKDFKKTLGDNSKIVATDMSSTAPALYFADKSYIVPANTNENYMNIIYEICRKENINVITTLIDPEIELLSKHRKDFNELNVQVLAPDENSSKLCFDKFLMHNYLKSNGINTVLTFSDLKSFDVALRKNEISFPVFVKPRTGSGSVGARKIETYEMLKSVFEAEENLIIQEYMGDALDLDADVYVDTLTNDLISVFSKKKLSTKIGGANKTISFKDDKLFEFIKDIVKIFRFYGAVDMDFFFKNGQYYLSEINPRFGGAYLHAYGAGVDFVRFIENNSKGKYNKPQIGDYEEDIIMIMYDSVVVLPKSDLVGDDFEL